MILNLIYSVETSKTGLHYATFLFMTKPSAVLELLGILFK